MNIAEWCIKNNRTSIVLLLLIVLAGAHTFRTMPRLEDPEFTIREAVVVTIFPGASPERVEMLVTDELESHIREIAQVERVESQSRDSVSVINVRIKDQVRDLQPIWQKLRNKVSDAERELPDGVDTPRVYDDFGDVFGILLALTGEDFSSRELKHKAEDIRDRLQRLPGAARVDLYGEQDERIYIEISNPRLANIGLSPYVLASMLQAQNAIQPGGSAKVAGERVVIEPTGEFKSVDDLRRTSLRLPGHEDAVLLGDIADIRRGLVDPPEMKTRFNGREAVILAVSAAQDQNIVHFGERVRELTADIRSALPVGMDLEELYVQPDFVSRSINEFMLNLGTAVLFVFVTMLFFTGLRTGVIAGAILPMAVLLSIALMPWFDVKLEKVSIASLIIALGLLVSNGIVMSENILVRINKGASRMEAATGAVRELTFPLLASQLTTIFAFLPIATAQSVVGEYCRSLFIVVAIALLGSWLLSLTFTPLMSCLLQKPGAGRDTEEEGRIGRLYRRILLGALRYRLTVTAAVAVATVLAIFAFRFVPTIFFPPLDREMLVAETTLPAGSDISVTEERVKEIEQWLLARDEVDSVGSMIGSGGPRWYLSLAPEQADPAYSLIMVHTREVADVGGLIPELREAIAMRQPSVRADVRRLEIGPPVGAPIQIRLSGEDIPKLYSLAGEVRTALNNTAGVFNIHDDWGEWTKKMVVEVHQEKAKRAGLSSRDISLSLLTQVSGLPVTEYRAEGDIIPVVMRSKDEWRTDLAGLEGLHVYSYAAGSNVPLLQVATTELEWEPSNIRRRDQVRTMTVKADVSGRYASDVLAELEPRFARLTGSAEWPVGYTMQIGGEDEESEEAQASILEGVGPAAALLLLVLLVQFNSVRTTLLIVLSIFPMMIGITPGMLLTRTPFGFMALLGLISLAGIIVNNAILLLDRVNTELQNGLKPDEALVVAAAKRLRPIVLMALTAVIGLLPLAIMGGAMWSAMANVMIFGLLTASVVGVIIIPVLRALFFGIDFRNFRWDPELMKQTD